MNAPRGILLAESDRRLRDLERRAKADPSAIEPYVHALARHTGNLRDLTQAMRAIGIRGNKLEPWLRMFAKDRELPIDAAIKELLSAHGKPSGPLWRVWREAWEGRLKALFARVVKSVGGVVLKHPNERNVPGHVDVRAGWKNPGWYGPAWFEDEIFEGGLWLKAGGPKRPASYVHIAFPLSRKRKQLGWSEVFVDSDQSADAVDHVAHAIKKRKLFRWREDGPGINPDVVGEKYYPGEPSPTLF